MHHPPQDWVSREGKGVAAGILIGFFCRALLTKLIPKLRYQSDDWRGENELSDDDFDRNEDNPMDREQKLVFCVRTDLKMQKGKIAAQVGHATLGAYKGARRKNSFGLRLWEKKAQTKIALQIRSEPEARRLEAAAKSRGLVTYMVYDAGRTQIAAGSMTVLAIGPGPADLIDAVTGHLKLL